MESGQISHQIYNYEIVDSGQISHQIYNYDILDSGQISHQLYNYEVLDSDVKSSCRSYIGRNCILGCVTLIQPIQSLAGGGGSRY